MRWFARSIALTARWDRAGRVRAVVPADGRALVIFCTWRRLDRLPHTLAMLAAQDVPVQAMIWDNSGDPLAVEKAIADGRVPVCAYHSPVNIGAFGRFYLAREASFAGHQKVVFIDDDQDFGPEAVGELLRSHRPCSLTGYFAFTQFRPTVETWAPPGERAEYVGTGGMAADSALFRDPALFTCPRRYWFLEDVWLSWFARRSGYELFASPAQFREVHDGLNQSLMFGWARRRFIRYLARRG